MTQANKRRGDKGKYSRRGDWTLDRVAFSERYFGDSDSFYNKGNIGLVTLLSDVQEVLAQTDHGQKEYYREALNDIKGVLIEDGRKLREAEEKQIKRYPKPEYDKCNQGHGLVEVYNEAKNEYRWDCPTCINRMRG